MQRGQPQQAMETYHMVLMLNPDLVDALSNLGSLYKSQVSCFVDLLFGTFVPETPALFCRVIWTKQFNATWKP